jgi:hypothetical protein
VALLLFIQLGGACLAAECTSVRALLALSHHLAPIHYKSLGTLLLFIHLGFAFVAAATPITGAHLQPSPPPPCPLALSSSPDHFPSPMLLLVILLGAFVPPSKPLTECALPPLSLPRLPPPPSTIHPLATLLLFIALGSACVTPSKPLTEHWRVKTTPV